MYLCMHCVYVYGVYIYLGAREVKKKSTDGGARTGNTAAGESK